MASFNTVIQLLSFLLPLFPALKEVGAKVPQSPLKKGGPIADNERYNFMSDLGRFGWEHTSCNFFAFDLQKKVFGRYLWPLECAFSSTATSSYLPSDNNFVEIAKAKGVEYAEAGFLVVAIKPGHIATLYPDGNRRGTYGYVIQAGDRVSRAIFLNDVWKSGFNDVKTYVFLGHILF